MKDQYQSIGENYVEARKSPATRFLEEPSVISALGDLRGKRVIDYACGSGHYTRLIKKLGAARVLGVDLSTHMIDLAREEESRHPLGVDYLAQNASDGAVHGLFDVATAIFLFNYADDAETLEKMFSGVAANLVDGGRLVAVVPNPDFVNGRGDTLEYGYHLEELERRPDNLRVRMHFTAGAPFSIEFTQWRAASYEAIMRRCGFDDIAWTRFSVSPVGLEMLGARFWQAERDNPKSVILSATRRGGA